MPGKGPAHSRDGDIQNIRQITGDYEYGPPILKELIQNADDAGASQLEIGWFKGWPESTHPLSRGPLLFAANNAPFTEDNSKSIRRLGISDKSGDYTKVGKFGIGLKSLFHICEAFFYIGCDGSRVQEADIFNPWSPSMDSLDEDLYPLWDEPETESERFAGFLKAILPEGPWATNTEGWVS